MPTRPDDSPAASTPQDPDQTRVPEHDALQEPTPEVPTEGIPFAPPRHGDATPTAPLDVYVPKETDAGGMETGSAAGAETAEPSAVGADASETTEAPAMVPPPPAVTAPPPPLAPSKPVAARKKRASLAPPIAVAGKPQEVARKKRRGRRYKPVFVGDIEGATSAEKEDSKVALLAFVIVLSSLVLLAAMYFLYQGLIADPKRARTPANTTTTEPPEETTPPTPTPEETSPPDPAVLHAETRAHFDAVQVLVQRRATEMNTAFRAGDAAAFETAWNVYSAEVARLGHVAYWRTVAPDDRRYPEVVTRLVTAADTLESLHAVGSAPLAEGVNTGAPFREVSEAYMTIRRLLNEVTQHLPGS